MILAIDPGRKPGYTLHDTRALVPRKFFGGRELPTVCGAWLACPRALPAQTRRAVTESQWLTGPRKKKAILRLAVGTGWQLHHACTRHMLTGHLLEVDQWRDALRLGNVSKDAAQKRCQYSLTGFELTTLADSGASPSRLGDLLDSIMIGWACYLIDPPEWEPPP